MNKKPIHVLLLEDNPGDARLFREFLIEDGLAHVELDHVERLKTGLEHLAQGKPDVILLDLGLPDSQGLETFTQVYAQAPEVPIVVLTGLNDTEQAVEAVRAGAQDYLVKGDVSSGLLVRAIRYAIERKRAEESLRESEERFRSLYGNVTVGMYRTTPDGRILMANPCMVRMLGFDSFEQLAQRNLEQEGHEPNYPRTQFLEAMEKHGEIMGLESAWYQRDGNTLYIRESARTIRDVQGQILYFDGTVEDVTERKRVETQLAERHATLKSLLESATTPVFSLDSEYRYTSFNNTHAAVMRSLYGAEIEIGHSMLEYQPVLEDQEEARKNLDRALHGEHFVQSAFSGEPGSTRHYFEVAHNPIFDAAGEVIGVSVFASDITERKRVVDKLEEERILLRTLIDNLPDRIYVMDTQGRKLISNLADWQASGGKKMEDVIGKTDFDTYPPKLAEEYRAIDKAVIDTGIAIFNREEPGLDSNGNPVWVLTSKVPLSDGHGKVVGLVGIGHDITVRRRALESLRESEARYRLLVDTASETILVAQDGMLKFVNRIASDLTGYSEQELTSRPFPEFVHPDDRSMVVENYQSRIKGNVVHPKYAFRLVTRDGRIKWVEISAVLIDWKGKPATLNFLIDITERKRAEEEIHHRLSELEVLYGSSLAIGQLLQPKEIGQKIIDILSERLQWHHATIRQYHPESETLELLAFHQPGLENEVERRAVEERFRTMVTQPGQGFASWVIQHGQAVYCGDVTKDRRYIEVWPEIRSGMYVPLKVAERTIGCLSVESERGNAFTETDEWLITTLAAQAASALENARLFEETSRRLKYVQALHTVDTAISSSLNLNVTIDIFLDQAVRLLGVDAADVLRFNPSTQILEYVSGYGFRTNALKHTRLRLGEGYAGLAGLERRIIQITHLDSKDTGLLRSPDFKSEGFETGFCVPLIAKSKLMGVLEIFHRSPLVPDQEWTHFLQTLAGQAAIAIDNITLFEDLQHSNLNLSIAYDATIDGWSRALELRDKVTEGHTQRVAELTMDLALALGVQEDQIIHIRRGALLHDIGKMGVPDEILHKPGPLNDDEWKIMRRHPGYAFDMLSPITYLISAVDIPYCHHEKWDGSGYPQGLKGEQIPLTARIFAVVDVYDALTSDRPYRPAWTKETALEHIREQSGKHFDPKVVEAFLRLTPNLK